MNQFGIPTPIKRRVFISHHKNDRIEVDAFIRQFANIFTPFVLGANQNYDLINSSNTDYVMSQIRTRYLKNTTITIVLLGSCTHSRRYVDWELKSSLRQGDYTPNGVMSIILPSLGQSAHLPSRLEENWAPDHINCYARHWAYPHSGSELREFIEDAHQARTTRAHLIKNSQDMMKKNRCCKVCNLTH
ncbi:MAG: TIR domain-containing protein [Opitutaceae bacterium]